MMTQGDIREKLVRFGALKYEDAYPEGEEAPTKEYGKTGAFYK